MSSSLRDQQPTITFLLSIIRPDPRGHGTLASRCSFALRNARFPWAILLVIAFCAPFAQAVAADPAITVQPVAQAVKDGQTATFTVTATGTAPLAYQWRLDGAAISGATGASYTTPVTRLPESGAQYSVVVGNGVGTMTSNDALLTVDSYTGAKYFSLIVEAVPTVSPPSITLKWAYQAQNKQFRIYRKTYAATTWTLMTSFAATPTSLRWTDTTVSVGVPYEYRIERDVVSLVYGSGTLSDNLCGGIDVPPVDDRGTVLLIVDATMAAPLAFELARLQDDLVADGWQVKRHDVPRGPLTGGATYTYDPAAVANVKGIITADYQADPTRVRSVFLFGHVPVPYSGDTAWDGHLGHKGAWACDLYYADVDGVWTDTTVNLTTTVSQPQNVNVPGDGKWDQAHGPSAAELEVGRVDLSNLPAFLPKTETDLLRQYLDKDHAQRQATFVFGQQGIVEDYFFEDYLAAMGWDAWASLFGKANVAAGTMSGDLTGSRSYAGYYLCGAGSATSCWRLTTANWAALNPKAEFCYLFGSWFGDWDQKDDFLRAPLATGYGLASLWSLDPTYLMGRAALGGSFGEVVKLSGNTDLYHNNWTGSPPYSDFISLMGDPTLRFLYVAPPSAPQMGEDAAHHPLLTWTASSASPLLGYHVYRSASASGPFTRLTATPVTGTTYTDGTVTTGTWFYQVKAAKMESTAGGRYVNLSLAATAVSPVAASGTLAFSSATYRQVEGSAGTTNVVVTVTRTGGSSGAASVQYASSAGTATAGSDYTQVSGTLSWAAGDAGAKTFTVPVIGDAAIENDETVNLTLGAAGGASLGASAAQVVIANDDLGKPGTIEFTSTRYAQVEGNSGFTNTVVTLTRVSGSYGAVSANLVVGTDGTATLADHDYATGFITVAWTNGQLGSIQVNLGPSYGTNVGIAGDTRVEPDEYLGMSLAAPTGGATIGLDHAQLLILNDDGAATAPTIIAQPLDQTVTAGTRGGQFTVLANGVPAPTYQWRKNGAPITGATAAVYTTPSATSADNGALFTVVVTNSAGSVTSTPASLTVRTGAAVPVIRVQPVNVTVNAGASASFLVIPDSPTASNFSYQWRRNGIDIPGANGSGYSTPPTVPADSGAVYSVTVNNGFGVTPSANATLTVLGGAAAQDITGFNAFGAHAYGDAPFSITGVAGGGSGNAVAFTSDNPAVATVSGTTVTIVGAGSATISADQAAGAGFSAAPTVQQVLSVAKASLSVTAAAASRSFGTGNPLFTGTVTGIRNGDPITATYASTATAGTAAGIYGPVTAQAIIPTLLDPSARLGNYTVSVLNGTLTISSATQAISNFTAFGTVTYGSAPLSLAGVSGGASGMPVVFTSSNTTVATVSGSNVTIVGAGSTTITASQAGNANFTAAVNVVQPLVVSKAALTVTAAAATRAFGAANPTFTGTISGLKNSDPITATYASTANASTAVGVYGPATPQAITPTLVDPSARLGNYTVTSVLGTLTIASTAQAITGFTAFGTVTYGSTPLSLTSVSGGASGLPVVFTSSNAAVATISGANVVIVGAGSATITASQAGSGSFAAAVDVAQPLVVGKAALTVTATAASRAFGAANPTFTGTISGLKNGDPITAAYASAATASTAVGVYGPATPQAIIPTLADPSARLGNYTVSAVNGSLTIIQATQVITGFTAFGTVTYGSTPLSLTSVSGGASGMPVVLSSSNTAVATVSGTSIAIVGAGSATITASQVGTANYAAAVNVTQPLVVGKAALTVTAAAASRAFGAANPTFTGTISGIKNADPITATYASTATAGTAVGVYGPATPQAITPTLVDPSARLGNYAVTTVLGTLTIASTVQTISGFTAFGTVTYGSAPLSLAGVSGGASGMPVAFSSSNTAVATVSGVNVTIVGAGSVTITASQAGSGNFAAAVDVAQPLVVGKATLTVTAAAASRVYGAANPTFTGTITGIANGDPLTATFASTANPSTAAGVYGPATQPAIIPRLADPSLRLVNYTVISVNGTLTITQAAQAIRNFAAFGTITYGSAPLNLGGVGGGNSGMPVVFTSSNTAVATVSGTNVVIVGAGSATISANQAGTANFTAAATATQPLVVGKAALTVTAAAASRAFGAGNPAFSGTITGIRNSDPLTATYASTATASTVVGTYGPATAQAITPTLLDPSARLGNYTVTSVLGTLTITPAAQVITGFAAFGTVTYGSTPLSLSGVGGGASGLPVTFTSSNTAVATISGANVVITGAGSATITAKQSGNGNYAAAVNVAQPLVVGKAALTVTATAATRAFGAANPAFTGTISGIRNSDPLTATYASTATASTAVGVYGPATPQAITPTLVDPSARLGNYTMTSAPGTLTITPAPQVISNFAAFGTVTYGSAPLSLSTVSGGASGQAVVFTSSNTAVATISGTTLAIVGAGSATITASQAGSTNFAAAAPVAQPLVVGKATLTVTAAAATRSFGAANPTFTGTISGIRNGDPLTATYASAATASTAVGVYGPATPQAITPTLVDPSARLGNYIVTSVLGTLTITTAPPTAPAAPAVIDPQSATPTISGTAALESTVTIFLDGSVLATASTGGDGAWSYIPVHPFQEGDHRLSVAVTDGAGTSDRSPEVDILTDARLPGIGTIAMQIDGTVQMPITSLTINGSAIIPAADGSWSRVFDVPPGANLPVTVVVRDGSTTSTRVIHLTRGAGG